jgi:hypothetical protein
MRRRVKRAAPAAALEQLLAALEQELIEAADEEILQVAADLGMNPQMPGSAAFRGLTFPEKPQLSDFFELDLCRRVQTAAERPAPARGRRAKRRGSKQLQAGVDKNPGEK